LETVLLHGATRPESKREGLLAEKKAGIFKPGRTCSKDEPIGATQGKRKNRGDQLCCKEKGSAERKKKGGGKGRKVSFSEPAGSKGPPCRAERRREGGQSGAGGLRHRLDTGEKKKRQKRLEKNR